MNMREPHIRIVDVVAEFAYNGQVEIKGKFGCKVCDRFDSAWIIISYFTNCVFARYDIGGKHALGTWNSSSKDQYSLYTTTQLSNSQAMSVGTQVKTTIFRT